MAIKNFFRKIISKYNSRNENRNIEAILLYGSGGELEIEKLVDLNSNNEINLDKILKNIAEIIHKNKFKVNDVDLMVIHSEHYCLSKRAKINKILFDLYYIDFWDLFRQVVSGSANDKIYSVANGKVLYDSTEGLLDLLVDFAKQRFLNGTEPANERSKIFSNTGMQNILLEVEKYLKADKPIDALAIMNRLFSNLINNYFVWNGIWDLPNKKKINYIKETNEKFYGKIEEYVNEHNAEKKFLKIKSLYFDLIMPHSTFLQGSWEVNNTEILQNDEIELLRWLNINYEL